MHYARELLPHATPRSGGWLAKLDLEFARRGERSVLSKRLHQGPLLVQRAFYPEASDVAHVYLLHPPGGVVGGDELVLSVNVHSEARALLTAPGATKLYRCPNQPSRIQQRLTVEAGAQLEWFPQETIVFSGARCGSQLHVDLHTRPHTALPVFIGWDIIALGRPGSLAPFESGELVSGFAVHVDAEPLLTERLEVCGGSPILEAAWGLRGAPVLGNFCASALGVSGARTAALVEECRQLCVREYPDRPNEWKGLTALGQARSVGASAPPFGCIVARYLGDSAERAKRWMTALWRIVRPVLLGREACVPRIWAT